MSYVSLLKNIPEILSQPTGIAAIASLGIHGAIALIVPLMPVDSNKSSKTDSSQAVGLMELSQADQNRLPQAPNNTSQVALQQPQLPLQQQLPPASFDSQSTILPPLPSQQAIAPIATSPANYNVSYLPRRQSLQKFTRNDFQTQVSNFRARSTFSPSASPFVNDLDAKIRETEPLNLNRLPEVQADNKLPGEPLSNPSPDAIDIGSTTRTEGMTQPQKMPGDNGVQVAQNSPSEFTAEQSLQGKGQLASAGSGLVSSPETSTKQPPELPTFSQSDSQGKKTQQLLASLSSYNSLRKTVQQEYPNAKEQAVIRETISTDKKNLEGTVLGRLVVDPDGKVLDIKFQDRSVAPELQSKAREFFSANPPKVVKRTSSYPFQLRFKNNNDSNILEKTPEVKSSPNPDSQKVSEPQQDKKNQLNTQSVIIPNSLPTPIVSGNQPVLSTESSQKLIQQLRQIKEERKSSN